MVVYPRDMVMKQQKTWNFTIRERVLPTRYHLANETGGFKEVTGGFWFERLGPNRQQRLMKQPERGVWQLKHWISAKHQWHEEIVPAELGGAMWN